MCDQFDVIAFDADDTLWHNEAFYLEGREFFGNLLSNFVDFDQACLSLDEIEKDNVHYYGYGIKSFILSMIETAIKLSNGQIKNDTIQAILVYAKQMVKSDPIHFPGTSETLEILAKDHDLMIITKGDLHEQQGKIGRSGLAHNFRYIEVVSEKIPATYSAILNKYAIPPTKFIMIGNSLRSDILPVLEIGAQAIYIPYEFTWVHENVIDKTMNGYQFHEVENISQVPEVIQNLCGQ